MFRNWSIVAIPLVGLLSVAAFSAVEKPDDAPANPKNIEAALKITLAAATEYEIRVGKEENEKPLDLLREPVLKWSNPEAGDVHGNVFLWTREGRPLVIGCLFKWFSPNVWMEHELHSTAEEPLSAKFHEKAVWRTTEAGLRFEDIPKAPAPAANEAQRLLQLKQLAKEFSGIGKYRMLPNELELRLLPQPVHRYNDLKHNILSGGLFAFVRGTDPDIFLLIEARGKDVATARWQFAAIRMHCVADLRLMHQNQKVWEAESYTFKEIFDRHERIYTCFKFNDVPDFIKEAIDKPKP